MPRSSADAPALVFSIDIGSTWTKGALFRPCGGRLALLKKESVPTSREDLSQGFGRVWDALRSRAAGASFAAACSSSAHGGLKMAAVGLVPDLTLKAARLAALSAGARLVSARSYSLLEQDVRALEEDPPDILLLTGGTDGGNRRFLLHNASLLGESSLEIPILYGGNRDLQDPIRKILKNKELYLADNVLPDLRTPRPEGVRRCIREIFLSRIIRGKGLEEVVRRAGSEAVPTPGSLYDFLEGLRLSRGTLPPFGVVDLGGATTDCYSLCSGTPREGRIMKGLPEPELKRSVEGDLGLRISAPAVWEAPEIREEAPPPGWDEYARRVSRKPELLAETPADEAAEALLAGLCVRTAWERHAGRLDEVYTPQGRVFLQAGKDLAPLEKIIGTGGYLSRAEGFDPALGEGPRTDREGRRILLPSHADYQADREYLLPLLANASRVFPGEAAATMLAFCEEGTWS